MRNLRSSLEKQYQYAFLVLLLVVFLGLGIMVRIKPGSVSSLFPELVEVEGNRDSFQKVIKLLHTFADDPTRKNLMKVCWVDDCAINEVASCVKCLRVMKNHCDNFTNCPLRMRIMDHQFSEEVLVPMSVIVVFAIELAAILEEHISHST